MSGSMSHYGGLAAEDSVARHYQASGHRLRARRWRGRAGEIDLILADSAGNIVFVEVKSSRDFDRALHSLGARQLDRIARAACEYVGNEPAGQDTPMRFDLAVVDGTGALQVLPDILH